MTAAPPDFAEYVGRQERRTDRLDAHRIANLAALLDVDVHELAPGLRLPPLAHWLHFNRWARQSQLGSDGHPKRGGFMPPIALPRRMFAGARLQFHETLHIGEEVERVATIASIQRKTGSSGELVFVTVKHEITGPGGLAIREEQDIVYRGNEPASSTKPAKAAKSGEPSAPDGAVVERVNVDPVMLFRFSAITDNGHRIHYDHPYVTKIEGYPGLVVHGPYQAMLLADLVRKHFPGRMKAFSFQARKPLFDTSPFECVAWRDANTIALLTRDMDGNPAMTAKAELTV